MRMPPGRPTSIRTATCRPSRMLDHPSADHSVPRPTAIAVSARCHSGTPHLRTTAIPSHSDAINDTPVSPFPRAAAPGYLYDAVSPYPASARSIRRQFPRRPSHDDALRHVGTIRTNRGGDHGNRGQAAGRQLQTSPASTAIRIPSATREPDEALQTSSLEIKSRRRARGRIVRTLRPREPLLVEDDLEELWAWGLEKFGFNGVQTNGTLVNDNHIRLFKQYKVQVGLSIDSPGTQRCQVGGDPDEDQGSDRQDRGDDRAALHRGHRAEPDRDPASQQCDRGQAADPARLVPAPRPHRRGVLSHPHP